jgi:acetyl-CoA acetyltransferase
MVSGSVGRTAREVVICAPLRTPVGRYGGVFRDVPATLLHELTRREQRYGLETMCIGGGQGLAALFERIG